LCDTQEAEHAGGRREEEVVTVREAKDAAREWVLEHASEVPGLYGVFIAGSVNWRSDGSEYSPLSDVDLFHIVTGDPELAMRQRKHMHKEVLLETEAVSHEGFVDAEAVLGAWRVAAHFSVPSIVYDPSGHLSEVQRAVATHYAEEKWVRRRCSALESEARQMAAGLRGPGGLDDRLAALVFAANYVQQIPLVASLKPPTVRKAHILFTDAMRARGQPAVAEILLALTGSARMGRSDVERLLADCTTTYDRALEVHSRPTPFDFDLCPAARHVMIGGSQDMIDRGYHREAAAWILVSHWIARKCLELEMPDEYERTWRGPYERLLEALGIGSLEAIARRAEVAEELLARTMAVAETIIGRGGRP
jgi:hypothetical protein